jgi:serine/threonine-protein kinase RsbW
VTDDARPAGHDEDRLELSAPAEPAILDLVHALIEELWTIHPGVGAGDRTRFELAITEVVANIVEHAYRLHPTDEGLPPEDLRRLSITLSADAARLLATMEDNGRPAAVDLSKAVMPDPLAESGRGLAIANASVDQLYYERRDGRNHWRVVCDRRPD